MKGVKKTIQLLCVAVVLAAFVFHVGFTDSSYYLKVNIHGDFDGSIGTVSLHRPDWILGNKTDEQGNVYFDIPEIPSKYDKIHYAVSNKRQNSVNTKQCNYYIKIVDSHNDDNNLPITYTVRKYVESTALGDAYTKEYGYFGPFVLTTGAEATQYYSLEVNFTDEKAAGMQNLSVQIITRANGVWKVISAAPLNFLAPKAEVPIIFSYYVYGGANHGSLISTQTITLKRGFTIDFTDSALLASIGITIPAGYTFNYATNAALSFSAATSVTVPYTARENPRDNENKILTTNSIEVWCKAA